MNLVLRVYVRVVVVGSWFLEEGIRSLVVILRKYSKHEE